MSDWWKSYFDEIYLEIHSFIDNPERNRKEAQFIKAALNLPQNSKILDLACGQGRHAVELAKIGYDVVGLDYSPILLEHARKRARENGVSIDFVNGDMRNIPFQDESFDGVFSFYTAFGYFDDDDNFQALKEMARVVKKGRKILIDMHNPINLFKNLYRRYWLQTQKYWVLEEIEFEAPSMRIYNHRKILKGKEVVDERTHFVRLYTSAELTFLLKSVGLEVIAIYGDYDLSDYSESSRRLVWVAEKR